MKQDRLKELMTAAHKTASDLIGNGVAEPIMPVFILMDRMNKVHIVGTPFSSDEEKDATAEFIRREAKRIGATAYIHVSEAWMKSVAPGEVATAVRPSQSESRREVLIVAGEDTDGKTICRMWAIERDDNNKRSLGAEDKSLRELESLGGRFANLLSE